jgi:mRNA interferase MazF
VILTPRPTGPDVVVAYLSSVVPEDPVPSTHLAIRAGHPEFADTGLRQASIVRLDKLMTISRSLVRRRLGRLGPSLLAGMDDALRTALGL